ncbi:hypothetical protein D2N39_11640 [Gemmobacter lutimaris]|jgi:hypothetical protein|uniref:Uncharacterized protein n=1 Tax=Gemmobacter lutimaris TaxID=2306023 RepID=A0A398BSK5_9RHOB|nr:hypothetical protein [Gemmobacter lutimaris]RID91881.1 hypothetical protein D2N39_11640 [Gemmobacter lutimaris]
MTEVRVHPRHSRTAEYDFCFRGLRRKARELGIDFKRFVQEGIPASELEHIEDAGLKMMIETAKKEAAQANGR